MYTFTEYQEPADPCGHVPTVTECEAVSRLLMLAAKRSPEAAKLAHQIAIAYPQERARAKVREERDRARATR